MYNQLVSHVGKVAPSEKDMEISLGLLKKNRERIDAGVLFHAAETQGVLTQVYHNIYSLKERDLESDLVDEFLDKNKEIINERKSHVSNLVQDLDKFAEEAANLEVQYLVIKGGCFTNLYPTDSFRTMHDIDLLISENSVWDSIKAFDQIGYRPKRIRVEAYPFSNQKVFGKMLGIAEMYRVNTNGFPFDLHLGAFPGCGDSILEAEVWSRAQSIKIGSKSFLSPSFEDSILIICAHISRHGYARLRDLNDISVCLSAAKFGFDWNYLVTSAKRNNLQAILSALLYRINSDNNIEIPNRYSFGENIFRIMYSKLMFEPGKQNNNFHGGRQLTFSRFLQVTFLYQYSRKKLNIFRAIHEAIIALYFLNQNGRPYKLWKKRKVLSLLKERRIVIIPINNKKRWKIESIHFDQIQKLALNSGVSTAMIGRDTLLWNVGDDDEIMITKYEIYTQSSYHGDVEENDLIRIRQVASKVLMQLNGNKAAVIEFGAV